MEQFEIHWGGRSRLKRLKGTNFNRYIDLTSDSSELFILQKYIYFSRGHLVTVIIALFGLTYWPLSIALHT